MRAGNQFTNASATPISKVSKGHAGSPVGEKGLVDVTLVGVLVADKSAHTVETLSFILTKVEDEGDQCRQDGAEVHFWEAFAKAKEDLFNGVQACFVETVSA